MGRTGFRVISIFALAAALFVFKPVYAQEHPEHPSEHPSEHPKAEQTKETVTIPMLSKAIQDYIAGDAKLKGGFYLVYDPLDKKVLQLTLAKVHEDKLATLGDGVYFACADFKSTDGHVYDLDVFMTSNEKTLDVSEVSVHKLDGKPRYNWTEKDGIWKKTDVPK
jgi:hypothetical protein